MWGRFAGAIEEERVGPPDGQLIFTGHSLGGALAVLAAARAAAARRAISAVYTFGMPRTGNAAFADDYNRRLGDRTYRLVYGSDIVPTVPPSADPKLPYRHVGRYLRSVSGRFEDKLMRESPKGQPEKWSDEPTF